MLKRLIEQNYSGRADVIAAALIENSGRLTALTDGFDTMVLIVTLDGRPDCFTHHYSKDMKHIQERWYSRGEVEALLAADAGGQLKQWLMTGEIVLDKEGFLKEKRETLLALTPDQQERRLLFEFSRFLRHFLLSKDYMEEGDLLDSHSHILLAVHHWAQLSVIENGCIPRQTVWRQVRSVNPGIFKLYEELTMNTETLEQRIRLAHLACDFAVMSKLQRWCEPLLRILASRPEPWSACELESHPALHPVKAELYLLLKKLVQKSLVREVFVASDSSLDVLETRYIK